MNHHIFIQRMAGGLFKGRGSVHVSRFTFQVCLSYLIPLLGLLAIAPVQARATQFFESLPASSNSPFAFLSRGQNYAFAIAPTEARIALRKISRRSTTALPGRERLAEQTDMTVRSLRMEFIGANPAAIVRGNDELPGRINYFIGNDPAQWRCGVSMFSRVRVCDLYPGVSLVYYGNGSQLEYDFELAPGANPQSISFRIEGADALRVSDEGDLVIRLGDDEVRQLRPEIYQSENGARKPIEGRYQLTRKDTVEIAIDHYNQAAPLVIDPQLVYSTYFGGNFGDQAFAVKVDTNPFVYIAGHTLSTDFLFFTNSTFNTFTNVFQGGRFGGRNFGDAFIAKFDDTGANPPLYFTYLGGETDDGALDLAIDSQQHAYLTGYTGSTNFPTRLSNPVFGLFTNIPGAFDPIANAFPIAAFVTEIDTTTTGTDSLVFSAYMGGNFNDQGIGIALDQSRNIYITGTSQSDTFPIVNGFQTNRAGSNDIFVAKISADAANGVVYSSYLGGTNIDEGQGIAVAGNLAFITGYTASTNFPITPNALQHTINGNTNPIAKYKGNGKAVPLDAFLAVFDTSQSGSNSLLYSSYFGGTNDNTGESAGNEAGYRITLDTSTNVYITGNTTSTNFTDTHSTNPNLVPILNYRARTNALNYDAILSKFHLPLSSGDPAQLLFSFPFGGRDNDVGWDIALDPAGDIFISGVTASVTNFAASEFRFLQATNAGFIDAFVTAFAPNATNLLYSAFFGGKTNDFGYGIAADASGNAYLTGQTLETKRNITNDFPVLGPVPTIPALQEESFGTNDAFLAKISLQNATPMLLKKAVAPTNTNVPGSFQVIWPLNPEYELVATTNLQAQQWIKAGSIATTNGWNVFTIVPTNPVGFFRLKKL